MATIDQIAQAIEDWQDELVDFARDPSLTTEEADAYSYAIGQLRVHLERINAVRLTERLRY